MRIDLSHYYLDAGLKRYEGKKQWSQNLPTHESRNQALSCTTICIQAACYEVDTKISNRMRFMKNLVKKCSPFWHDWVCLRRKATIAIEMWETESVDKIHSIVNKNHLQHVGSVSSGQQRNIHNFIGRIALLVALSPISTKQVNLKWGIVPHSSEWCSETDPSILQHKRAPLQLLSRFSPTAILVKSHLKKKLFSVSIGILQLAARGTKERAWLGWPFLAGKFLSWKL